MPTYTNPKGDRRTITHTGAELGASLVDTLTNATGREDAVLRWECPRKYDQITFAAGRHPTDFTPRYKENFDGDGTTTTFNLTGDIAPPYGESQISDMDYQPVVAYDDVAGTQIDVESYDFTTNSVTLASAPDSGTGNVHLWPVLIEGHIKYVGVDQFNHTIAALDEWGIPLHVFNDFNQRKNMTKVHLTGAVTWEESEKLEVQIESPREIVWEDADFPNGQYASQIRQKVDVDV